MSICSIRVYTRVYENPDISFAIHYTTLLSIRMSSRMATAAALTRNYTR